MISTLKTDKSLHKADNKNTDKHIQNHNHKIKSQLCHLTHNKNHLSLEDWAALILSLQGLLLHDHFLSYSTSRSPSQQLLVLIIFVNE